jgi:hypothetical protein
MVMSRFLFVFILITLIGCKEVSFKEPQPKDKKTLSSIPKNLQGKYLTLTEDGQLSKDTVIITEKGYRFGYFDPAERATKNGEYEEGSLSDSLVLRSFKGYYFLNMNEDPEWLLRVIYQEKNGDLQYMALEEKDAEFNEYLERLSREVRIDSVTTPKETLYQIDPSPNQLVDLIDKGFFSKTRLVKIGVKK